MNSDALKLASTMSFALGSALMKLVEASEKNGQAGVIALEEAQTLLKTELSSRAPKPKKSVAKKPAKATTPKAVTPTAEVVQTAPPVTTPKKATKVKPPKETAVVEETEEEDDFSGVEVEAPSGDEDLM